MKKLTYAILQPLTGGAVFAAENVFGYSPEYILSYNGLEAINYNKQGDIIGMGNERHFLEHLKKNNKLVSYMQFQQGMFDYEGFNGTESISIQDNEEYKKKYTKSLKGLDLIAAVPVCSGLSGANTTDHGQEDSVKNNNMKFLLEYTLKELKPKVYLFENAPGLYTNKGIKVREYLNKAAEENGYSVTYVKTDTMMHNNVQHRPRTFAIFWQWIDNKPMPPPVIGYENKTYGSVTEYLALIPKNATQQDLLLNEVETDREFQFVSKIKNWREKVGNSRLKSWILFNHLEDDFYKFHRDDKLKTHYDYCRSKLDKRMGFYDRSFFVMNNVRTPTVYHGNTWSAIHPTENRCLSFREYIHLMGMPHDFEYLHNKHSFGSVIGQNVPVKTFEFWIRECKKVLDDWDNKRVNFLKEGIGFKLNSNQSYIIFHDNLKRQSFYG